MKHPIFSFLTFLIIFNLDAQTWIPQGQGLLPIGYVVLSISAVDDTVIWVTAGLESVVNSGTPVPIDHKLKVLRSVDGGLHWQSHDVGTGRFSFDIIAVSADTAWITTQSYGNGIDNSLFRTDDGGITWKNKLINKASGVFLRRFDNTHLLCQVSRFVARSENSGETWIPDTITSYLPNEFNTLASGNNMASVVGDTLWVGTTLGRVVRFTDYGASREMIYTGTIYSIQSLSFADHLRGMIFHYTSTGATGFSRTYDGGNTWELTPSKPQTDKYCNITYVPGTPSTFFAVTDFSQDAADYFWTTDFGSTWSKGGEIKDAQTNAVQFLSPTIGWVSTGTVTRTDEPIVYKWSGDIFTGTGGNVTAMPGFEISPNPVTDKIDYTFENDENKIHRQSILDINGRVLQSDMTTLNEMDVSHMPAGIYFLQIASEDRIGTRMFVKVSE